METAVVGRGLPAKQLIRRADRKRRTVREKPMLHTYYIIMQPLKSLPYQRQSALRI
jgi:hypothetical protein